ncbi:hypothetical protein WJ0W_007142 [Paenibacillus melissococcoides]|uniref:Uncharacterized protein n=1 Tax=Paenibacillus melissococcoides TaxID=2912268 RepID=A0ABN8UBC1_9BACL|nr:hypothetical protein [Paenibacillus melissococcoides]CAH8248474.1 hypothetical protein WJ0W_007142 [Paenibacillus melissococcoides]CAH8722108.1 hypothetical protein HTL2_006698 [Paenibacillus melissococcoides]CAH8722134.1 hypothetical protein WDD9_006637 [Paenibacillus melissococcoides]
MNFENEMARIMRPEEQPHMLYYVELHEGTRIEGNSALALFEYIAGRGYFDCESRITQSMMLMALCRNVAVNFLGAQGTKADVWASRRIFSNYESNVDDYGNELEFDPTPPYDLNCWDEQTTILSLVRCGYLKLYERVETFRKRSQGKTCDGCYFLQNNSCPVFAADNVLGRVSDCVFWTSESSLQNDYQEVEIDRLPAEPMWKKAYIPLSAREFKLPENNI